MSSLNTNDTNHHSSQGKGKANRLIDTKSPYLLQHAYNPVDWYPWCDEAFDKAKAENKPVFLSIGYSTCHWCHVMAHESFEDNEVAAVLNREYISIKVDREERPDIDAIYMTACQAMTGSGGWPLTVLMTPDQKPFFAGTYFPKHSRLRMPGLIDVLQRMSHTWKKQQHELLSAADTMTEYLRENADKVKARHEPEEGDPKEVIAGAIEMFLAAFDSENGGFGRAPKFPSPHNLILLMRYYEQEGDEQALKVVEKTLQQMYRGGIFDHIGYGFARYSTDEKWLAPHFEKMLYDNALLTMAYLEAYEITGKSIYQSVAEKTIAYISREMTDQSGGFYSAQDADSEGEEGKFYVFKPHEIEEVLGRKDANRFCRCYDIVDRGNFEGKSIPNLLQNIKWETIDDRIDQMVTQIYDYRSKRMSLHKDDKILTSWNALVIAALAKAYRILKDEQYLTMAEKALCFIEQHMTNEQGRLLARYRKGEAGILAYLDDYAFLIFAMLEMLEATNDKAYQQRAETLCKEMVRLFWDEENGGFFMYGNDATGLIARPKELYDGAMPSGNSVAAWNLVRLSHLAPDDMKMSERAYRQLHIFSNAVRQYPAGYSFFLSALMEEAYAEHKQMVYACGPQGCTVR